MNLQNLINDARKHGQKERVGVLQVLAGELARLPSKEYTAEQVYSAARKMIKNAEQFPSATSELEIAVLQSLLPAERSDEEVLAAIADAKTIKEAMLLAPADVDKARVSALFRSRK